MSQVVEGHETLNGFIRNTAAGCKTISFIGFEKGSGKTTALKAFLSALDSKTIGITSMGTPAVGSKTTPNDYPVYVPAGTIVATTRGALGMCDATREILHATGIQTPAGEVIVFRAISAGYVFLSGPSIIADSIKVRDIFFEAGADVALIDSAVDRKSAAYPSHADGVVVTGLLTRSAGKLHEDRLNQEMDSLLTPALEDQALLEILQDNLQSRSPFFVVDEHLEVLHAPEGENKHNIAAMIKNCPKNIKAIMIKGALTNSSILPVINLSGKLRNKLQGAMIAAEDPAKIFLDLKHRQSLEGLGIHLRVLRAARILALCLNPIQQGLNREQMVELLKAYSARFRLPVMDIVGGTYVERV